MKFIFKLSLAILVLAPVSWETTQASSDVILVKQERILKEEYQMVRQMRHRLRYLLEQQDMDCLLYTSPSPRDKRQSRMPSSA